MSFFEPDVEQRMERYEGKLKEVRKELKKGTSAMGLETCWKTCVNVLWDATELMRVYGSRIYKESGWTATIYENRELTEKYYLAARNLYCEAEGLCDEIRVKGREYLAA